MLVDKGMHLLFHCTNVVIVKYIIFMYVGASPFDCR